MERLVWIFIVLIIIKISSLIVGISQDLYIFIQNIYRLASFFIERKIE